MNVNIGMTVPYSHLLYLINGSIISGAKRCLQINERQLYLCRWRTTSSQSGAISAVEWMRSHSVFPSCCCCQVYDTGTAGSKLFAKCFTMGHWHLITCIDASYNGLSPICGSRLFWVGTFCKLQNSLIGNKAWFDITLHTDRSDIALHIFCVYYI